MTRILVPYEYLPGSKLREWCSGSPQPELPVAGNEHHGKPNKVASMITASCGHWIILRIRQLDNWWTVDSGQVSID